MRSLLPLVAIAFTSLSALAQEPMNPTSFSLPRLEAAQPKSPVDSLLEGTAAVPTALHDAASAEVNRQLLANFDGFAKDVEEGQTASTLAGGGDGDSSDKSTLAFWLGMAGFGLGHFIVAKDHDGGIKWMTIDIIMAVAIVASWIILPILFWQVFFYDGLFILDDFFYLAGVGVWMLVHLFTEAPDAVAAYKGHRTSALKEIPLPKRDEGDVANRPLHAYSNIMALSF